MVMSVAEAFKFPFTITRSDPEVFKLFFMLNSAEHKLFHAHTYSTANNCWRFNIYKHDKDSIRETLSEKLLSVF